MRIVVIGQSAFGAKSVEALLDSGETVVGVYAPEQKSGGKADPIKEAALAAGIPVFEPKTFKSEETFSQYKALEPDLTVLAFVTSIVPPRYFEAASKGAICYHPSILPRHRGASAINWAIIMGEKKTGLTIFWPDEGIDTGPILLRKETEIGPEDTAGSLYFERLFPMGIEALVESTQLIREGRAPKIIQDEAKSTYEPPCDDSAAAIDWKKSSAEIFNLIRGCDPQPGAYSYWQGEKSRFFGAKSLTDGTESGPPGAIAQIDGSAIHILVPGGRLIVSKIRGPAGAKMSAADWAEERKIRAGDRFDDFS